MSVTSEASTTWTGSLFEGSGEVDLATSHQGPFAVNWKARSEGSGSVTTPEELIAAAHSSCYAMQFSAVLAEAGATPVALEVTAEVTLGPDPAGGFQIPKIALTVRGEVEGIDEAGFQQAAETAKATCPVSKALAGVPEVTLDAALDR